MSNKERLFSWRRLLRLIWPLLVEQLLTVLVGMVDVLMVAFVGEAAVSGVSLVDSINHLVLQFLFAMTAGGTVVCAKYIGGGDYASARKSGGQLLSVTTAALLLLSIVMLCGGESILRVLFGTVAPEVMRDAEVYMRFTAVSFPFLAVYHSAASIFRAEGNTRLSMLVSQYRRGYAVHFRLRYGRRGRRDSDTAFPSCGRRRHLRIPSGAGECASD